ncbi:hypothetical protein [Nisaea sp.]|uniref:hypothetical protein n=1 Tax=Nisaea sp. TaxID=2024842 RepID=UPI002B26B74C|nr:hypothetical protein [Nisaea sp.]
MSEKNQYIEKARARIAQSDAEIDRIKARADEAGADAKIEYQSSRMPCYRWLTMQAGRCQLFTDPTSCNPASLSNFLD